MITKVFKTTHLNSTIDYVYREDKDPLVVGSTCLDSEREGALSELRASIKQRPEIKKPVFHAVLSADLSDTVDNQQWEDIAQTYMDNMGFRGCSYVAVKHHDTDHEHIHIVASRIRPDRSLVPDSFDHYRTQEVARGLEQRHNLKQLECGWEKDVRQPTQQQWHQQQRTGQVSERERIQKLIEHRLQSNRAWDMTSLKDDLSRSGVQMKPRLAKDKSSIIGVYFERNGVKIPGSKIDRRFGWNRLQQQVSYDKKRDFDALVKAPEVDQRKVKQPIQKPLDDRGSKVIPEYPYNPIQEAPTSQVSRQMQPTVEPQVMRKTQPKVPDVVAPKASIAPKKEEPKQPNSIDAPNRTQPATPSPRPESSSPGAPPNVVKKADVSLVQKQQVGVGIDPRVESQRYIYNALDRANWRDGYQGWVASLEASGVKPVPKVTQKDHTRIVGMYFEHDKTTLPGSSVARQYSWASLQKRLGPYDPKRDLRAFDTVEVPGQGRLVKQVEPKPQPQKPESQRPTPSKKTSALTPFDRESEVNRSVKDNPYLKNFTVEKPPVIARHQGKDLSLDGAIELQRGMGNTWRDSGEGKDQRLTLMRRDVVTREGRFNLLVDRNHDVLLVPYDKRLESVRGQDVIVGFDKSRQPMIKGRIAPQVKQPVVEQPTKVPLQDIKKHPTLSQFTSNQKPYLEAKAPGGQRLLTAKELVHQQQSHGQPWRVGIEQVQENRQRIMETDIKVQEGRMTLLVDRHHNVTLIPHDKRLDGSRGKITDARELSKALVRTEEQPTKAPDRRADVSKEDASKSHVSLEQWREHFKANDDTRSIEILRPGERHRGKLLEEEAHLKEGRFLVVMKPTADMVLIPYEERLKDLKGKDVKVEQLKSQVKVTSIEKDKGPDLGPSR